MDNYANINNQKKLDEDNLDDNFESIKNIDKEDKFLPKLENYDKRRSQKDFQFNIKTRNYLIDN